MLETMCHSFKDMSLSSMNQDLLLRSLLGGLLSSLLGSWFAGGGLASYWLLGNSLTGSCLLGSWLLNAFSLLSINCIHFKLSKK